MSQKDKGISTSLPEEILPNSELKCIFCKNNGNSEDMSYTMSRNKYRWAYHRRCMAEYKKEKRRDKEMNTSLIHGVLNADSFISVEYDELSSPIQTIYDKLING